jgi:hypothetical protein
MAAMALNCRTNLGSVLLSSVQVGDDQIALPPAARWAP